MPRTPAPTSPSRASRLRTLGFASLAIVVCARLTSPPPLLASDLWDRVRDPGARACLRLVTEAREALRKQDAPAALALADRALAASKRADAWIVRARALALAKRPRDAVEAMRQALALDPRALDRKREETVELTLAAIAAEEIELAARILGRLVQAMDATADRRSLYVLYADLLNALGPERAREATIAYRHALHEMWNREPRALVGLALVLHRTGNVEEARRQARFLGTGAAVLGLIAKLPLPDREKAARRAVLLEAAQRDATHDWRQAGTGPWGAHALGALAERSR